MIVPPTSLNRSGSATMVVGGPAGPSSSSSSSSSPCLLQPAPGAIVDGINKKHVTQIKQIKSVSFHDKVKMRKVRKLTDYDESTRTSDIWYSSEELQETHSQVFDILDLMDNNDAKTIRDLGMCTRGLESKTNEGHQRKVDTRYHSMCVVLEEQYRQWKLYDTTTMIDLEVVADKYSQACAQAKEVAYQIALRDQEDAL